MKSGFRRVAFISSVGITALSALIWLSYLARGEHKELGLNADGYGQAFSGSPLQSFPRLIATPTDEQGAVGAQENVPATAQSPATPAPTDAGGARAFDSLAKKMDSLEPDDEVTATDLREQLKRLIHSNPAIAQEYLNHFVDEIENRSLRQSAFVLEAFLTGDEVPIAAVDRLLKRANEAAPDTSGAPAPVHGGGQGPRERMAISTILALDELADRDLSRLTGEEKRVLEQELFRAAQSNVDLAVVRGAMILLKKLVPEAESSQLRAKLERVVTSRAPEDRVALEDLISES